MTTQPQSPSEQEKKHIPFDKLQQALDLFDKVEVNYWDGDPRKLEIEGGGVAVLRVTDVSPMHSADGRNILSISTNSLWFSDEVVHLMPEPQLQALITQAADKREQELVGWLDAAIHTRLTRIEVDNGLKMPLAVKARKQFSKFVESEINAHIASQGRAAEGEGKNA